MNTLSLVALCLALPLAALAQFELQPIQKPFDIGAGTAPHSSPPSHHSSDRMPEGKWVKLDGVRFIHEAYHDADSFHATAGGKEYIFRLYFVDSPEDSKQVPERVKEQAKYFGVSQKKVLAAGECAARRTEELIGSGSFTVHTRWEDAMGSSSMPRYYAHVLTAKGQPLSEILVAEGWARSYGAHATIPGVVESSGFVKKLDELQARAKQQGLGTWSGSKKSSTPSKKKK